jgi:hypothetical protein
LVELKAFVDANDELKSLRKRLDEFTGLGGVKALKEAIMKKLGVKPAKVAGATGEKGKRGAKGKYLPDQVIHVLDKEGPPRKGTKKADMFAFIKEGMKISDAAKKGLNSAWVGHFEGLGYIKVA